MTASSGVHVRWYDDEYVCLHNGDTLEGPVRVWEDREAGLWGYTCHCGTPIEHDIYSPSERGATKVAGSLFTLGFLLTLGSLVSLYYTTPTGAHLAVSLAGVALMLLPLTAAAIGWLTRNGHTT